ncbi:MAG: hypothetical protein HYU67_04680 [Flavobacteriia bacterium]|nr:hypothetical protein [Flavobacteriia bacterium]
MTKIYVINQRLVFEMGGKQYCFPYLVSKNGQVFTIKSKDDTSINFSFNFSDAVDYSEQPYADEESLFYYLVEYCDISVDSSIVGQLETISSHLSQIRKYSLPTEKTNDYTITINSTPVKILNQNNDRAKLIFENASNQRIFIKYESASSPSNYSFSLAQNLPFIDDFCFTGEVWACTNAGTANLQITEYTL